MMKVTEVIMIAGGVLLIYAGITDFQILTFLKAIVVNPGAIRDIGGIDRTQFYGTTDPLSPSNQPASAKTSTTPTSGVQTV
jgi:hypothetical protein